jgi:hypothetical protein
MFWESNGINYSKGNANLKEISSISFMFKIETSSLIFYQNFSNEDWIQNVAAEELTIISKELTAVLDNPVTFPVKWLFRIFFYEF